MYGKIFTAMYDGSLYGNWEAIVTFQQMIVLCDIDGVVDMTPQAIAARTSIPLDIINIGLKLLEQPDQYSRTPTQEGKRIVKLDEHRPWGWKIVNYDYYRHLTDAETVRAQNRERQRRFREKESNSVSHDVTDRNAQSRQVEVEVEAVNNIVELARPDVQEVFSHWQKVMQHPKAKLTPERQRKIKSALKNYSAASLCKAIDGCSLTPHNMGQNDRHEVYDDICLILRDAGHIERFMHNADNPPGKSKGKSKWEGGV